jgi:hypothetical protein
VTEVLVDVDGATFALGRVQRHDERSRDFPAEVAPLVSVRWPNRGAVLDQGQVGSCTGNAMASALNHDPIALHRPGALLDESDAVRLYSAATRLDRFRGVYPPTDTGSSGLAVCKAAKRAGLITSYRHAFGLPAALGALARGPVLIGIPWLRAMFTPRPDGSLDVSGAVAGGHEVCLDELDVERELVWLTNSWGQGWGLAGRASLRWTELGHLLMQGGDCTVPVP